MRLLPLPMILLALVLAGTDAGAGEPQPAGEPVYATTVAALPEGVRSLLEQAYGGMADAGGEFATGCVRRAGIPHARLIEAELRPDRVLVRYEHGGFAGVQRARAEYRRVGDDWVKSAETGQFTRQVPAAPALPAIRWAGQPRQFTSAIDAVLPPLWNPGSN